MRESVLKGVTVFTVPCCEAHSRLVTRVVTRVATRFPQGYTKGNLGPHVL